MRDVVISVRLSGEVKAALDRAAAADGRSVSQWVERLIAAHVDAAAPPRRAPSARAAPRQQTKR